MEPTDRLATARRHNTAETKKVQSWPGPSSRELLLTYLNAPRAMRQSLMPDPERVAIVRRLFKHDATGTYTKQEILQKATQGGLTNRRG